MILEQGPKEVVGYVLKYEVIAGGYIFSGVLYFKQETLLFASQPHVNGKCRCGV